MNHNQLILIVVGLVSIIGLVFPIILDHGTETIYAAMGIKVLLSFTEKEHKAWVYSKH